MGGYWRVTAIGCGGPGIAGMVIGPAAAEPWDRTAQMTADLRPA
jgi:hypothetical protein